MGPEFPACQVIQPTAAPFPPARSPAAGRTTSQSSGCPRRNGRLQGGQPDCQHRGEAALRRCGERVPAVPVWGERVPAVPLWAELLPQAAPARGVRSGAEVGRRNAAWLGAREALPWQGAACGSQEERLWLCYG